MKREWQVWARVVRVVDGDTLILDLDLGWHTWRMGERCRLAGVNAPEIDTPEGKMARDFVQGMLAPIPPTSDQITFISKGLDKYGRPLGYVQLHDGRLLQDLLLAAGHAVVMK